MTDEPNTPLDPREALARLRKLQGTIESSPERLTLDLLEYLLDRDVTCITCLDAAHPARSARQADAGACTNIDCTQDHAHHTTPAPVEPVPQCDEEDWNGYRCMGIAGHEGGHVFGVRDEPSVEPVPAERGPLGEAPRSDLLRAKLDESERGWFEVAAALGETYAGGPKNLPARVQQLAERYEVARADLARAQEAVDAMRGEARVNENAQDILNELWRALQAPVGNSIVDHAKALVAENASLAKRLLAANDDLAAARGERARARKALLALVNACDTDAREAEPKHVRAALDAADAVLGAPAQPAAERAGWRELPQRRNGHAIWSLRGDDADAGPGTVQWWTIHRETLYEGWFAESGAVPTKTDLRDSLARAMADAEALRPEWKGAIRPAAGPGGSTHGGVTRG